MDALATRLTERFGPDRALVDPAALLAYECDGFTIHKSTPTAVVLPETTAEVAWTVGLCNELGVPFLARGAGTCLSGGPTPLESSPCVTIETARMKQILEIDAEDRFAVVQPGVVNVHLTRAVAHLGLHYAPDPSSQSVCTIGGNLAENSGGPHCFKYGMTTDHVLAATVVLPDGEIVEFGSRAAARPSQALDLLGLFTGSEGTFGIATEITVRLSQNPEAVRTLLAAFRDMNSACRAVTDIVAAGVIPAALEILDQATIQAVEASVYRAGYPQDAAAVLLVELDGAHAALDAEATEVKRWFANHQAIRVDEAENDVDRKRLWKGRKGAFGAMGRLNTDLYVLDGVVPRSKLEQALTEITAIGKRYRLQLTNVFHAGDGNLHPNISFDGRDSAERDRVIAAGHEILQLCVDLGGSITGEHGVGSEKLDHVPLMFTPADLDVMQRVRLVFNPRELCNPGKAIPERNSCAEVAKWPAMVEHVLDQELDDTTQ